ncbi:hypothetical protein LOAG_13034 [Loa loa]|uniref:THUMP domain-containing protein n=1 Tax=Loa loa TaxID=7209 RepID=A0A1I7VAR4_LOALO|nr:hypothetical protein LOAG_13034 [Loa loa]EFO15476.2 hypothetical protein LOAG_13034 [Loa loa]
MIVSLNCAGFKDTSTFVAFALNVMDRTFPKSTFIKSSHDDDDDDDDDNDNDNDDNDDIIINVA